MKHLANIQPRRPEELSADFAGLDRPLRVLSLGAGVQSTTLALMAAHGELEGEVPDVAIFADTGAEPRAVYEHLAWLASPNVLPFPVWTVLQSNLRDDILASAAGADRINGRDGGYVAVPFFTTTNGQRDNGMLRRQCTSEYKIKPIRRAVKAALGLPNDKPVRAKEPIAEMWIGISADEHSRYSESSVGWLRHRHPFLSRVTEKDKGWNLWFSRQDCFDWLARHDYPAPPKSACTFCPYHNNAVWRALREGDPESWDEAVRVDEAIRQHGGFAGIKERLYVHSSMAPLAEADLDDVDPRQGDIFGDCEGMCGV